MEDIRLIIIITALTLLVTALSIALSWFVNRRIPGAQFWSMGYFVMAGGVLLQATQGRVDPVFSIALANLLISCGMYFSYVGVSLFQGRQFRYRLKLSLLATFVVLVHVLVGLGPEGFAARTLLISGLISIISYMIAYGFWSTQSTGNSLVYRIDAFIYSLLGSAFGIRAFSVFFIPSQGQAVGDTMFSHATYIGATIFTVLIAFSYLITINSRYGMTVQRVVDSDRLTGLLNRDALSREVEPLLKRMHGLRGSVTAVFFRLNSVPSNEEQYSLLLKTFADMLLRSFQPQDLLARAADAEFVAVIENANRSELERRSSYLKQAFEENGVVHEGGGQPGVDMVVVDALPLTRHYDDLRQLAEVYRSSGGST